MPVDHLKKKLQSIHLTAKDFHKVWKRACDTASKCIAEDKEYNKQRYDKTNMQPDLKKGDQVLESTLNFDNLMGPREMRDSFVTGEDRFPCRNKTYTPQDIVEVGDSTFLVKKILKARKIRLNGKDQRQYLVRFKSQTADKDKWLAEDAIPEGNLHLRIFRASRRSEQSHQ
ncbi:hypothetical protein O181_038308 [Austropuccinia psidii MF-1]|uniref:Chromo domain-containing protein n=1 Tax=Austropuccinia psidii MF-1 TaxID=1389203 RepID=A0A9Q3HAW8_9BASI|nr:hypothetical protein [Austropuccinia psidii MF-1]